MYWPSIMVKQTLNITSVKEMIFDSSLVEQTQSVTFIDLFSGIGGTRIGFEQACEELNIEYKCVFSSEIKAHAVSAYKANFKYAEVHGDITRILHHDIPDFDFLLAGFPCQPFSTAGKRNGFLDKRGGLFFTILNILLAKKPQGFLLENVEGLSSHSKGETLRTIITELETAGYKVNWEILDASNFGVPQTRRRIYIVGHRTKIVNLKHFPISSTSVKPYLDYNYKFKPTEFSKLLTAEFSTKSLEGKSIKDKRGGKNNIHSWDIGLRGSVTKEQKQLLELILKKRRSKKWAVSKGIDWMDGMPLTLSEIKTFYNEPNLKSNLGSLVEKGYLRFEHPKKKISSGGVSSRVPCEKIPKGYNIVSGKLSFPIVKILNPEQACPTLVATEAGKIGVATDKGVRPITIQEGLHFSGFPENYHLDLLSYSKAFDLIGNTVMPPVIKAVALRLLEKDK